PDADLFSLDRARYEELERHDPTRSRPASADAQGADAQGAHASPKVQLLETEGLERGSVLAFALGDSSGAKDEKVELAEIDPDTWTATLKGSLQSTYTLERSFICGNLVDIDQGATEKVTLGSSNGAALGLRLRVYNRAPLLSSDPGEGR